MQIVRVCEAVNRPFLIIFFYNCLILSDFSLWHPPCDYFLWWNNERSHLEGVIFRRLIRSDIAVFLPESMSGKKPSLRAA